MRQQHPDLPPLRPPSVPSAGSRSRPPWVGLAIGLLIGFGGFAVGSLLAGRADLTLGESPLSFSQQLVVLALLLVCLLSVLLVHELGHIVGGKLGGFRFTLLIVGPLRVVRTADGLHFGVNRVLGLAGGLAGCLPTSDRNLKRGMMTFVAGGPVASLLAGALSLGLAAAVATTRSSADPDGVFFTPVPFGSLLLLGAFGLTSLVIGLLTLVPGTTGGFQTDGARLLELARGEDGGATTLMLLSAASVSGRRPRDWPAELVGGLADLESEDAKGAAIAGLRYLRALDEGELEAAHSHLQRQLDLNPFNPAALRSSALYEAAFFEAFYRRDLERSRALAPEPKRGAFVEPHQPLRLRAAWAWLEGRKSEVERLVEEGLATLTASLDAGTARVAREQLEALRDGLSRPGAGGDAGR